MENSHNTSFIPKNPVRSNSKPNGVRRVYIFNYVTLIFFFGTLLAAAGVFAWGITIEQQLSSAKSKLAIERDSFNQAELESVSEFEARMSTASGILNRSVSVFSIIDALEKTTLEPIQLLTFDYNITENNSLEVSMSLIAPDFNASLFQREVVSGNNILSGVEFSDIIFSAAESIDTDSGLEIGGGVSLSLTKQLSASDIAYTAPMVTLPDPNIISIQEVASSSTIPVVVDDTDHDFTSTDSSNANNQ